jgi:hypothetical protein
MPHVFLLLFNNMVIKIHQGFFFAKVLIIEVVDADVKVATSTRNKKYFLSAIHYNK